MALVLLSPKPSAVHRTDVAEKRNLTLGGKIQNVWTEIIWIKNRFCRLEKLLCYVLSKTE